MNEKQDPYNVTKSGLIRVGIISSILITIVFYLLNKFGMLYGNDWLVVVISLPIILLAVFIGIKIGRKNYERLKKRN